MITEDYVSFETAKLLKEKGFPQEYDHYHALVYNEEDYEDEYEVQRMVLETRIVKAGTLSSYPIGVPEPKCYCPTLQTVMKWLREVHNLFIFPFPQMNTNKFWTEIFQLSDNQEWENLYCESIDLQDYSTYEEACEAALKYCLEHLI